MCKSTNQSIQKNEGGCYGRVAKIIAIYIKTAVILSNIGKSELSKIAHPLIDRILLKNVLPKGDNIPNWTELNKKGYFDLLKKIRAKIKAEEIDANWKLEVYWDVKQ